ncbi:DUF3008 family protein [Glycocaulis profundi]|nr:DUF3008 family protein [Glycocaulis profundi]
MTQDARTPQDAAREALAALREGDTRLDQLSPEARQMYQTLAEDELEKMARGDLAAMSKGTRGDMSFPAPRQKPGKP